MPAAATHRRSVLVPLLAFQCWMLPGCGRNPESQNAPPLASGTADKNDVAAALVSAPPAHASGRSATNGQRVDGTTDPIEDALGRLLLEIIDDDGLVRYHVFRDPVSSAAVSLDRLRGQLAGASSAITDERAVKAELINAFNLNAIALVAEQQRNAANLKSVRDVPGFFDSLTFEFRGQSESLRDLEDRLASMGDPRVFAALVRATLSCPPLRREPYHADRLEQQLDDQCRQWLDDRSKNRTLRNSIAVSEIFQWHAEAFNAEPYSGAVGFLRKFSRPHGAIRDFIAGMKGEVKITYLPYDWRLNQAPDDSHAASAPPAKLGTIPASSQPANE